MYELLDGFNYYMDAGGYVMPPLILLAVLMWYGIGYRWSVIKRGSKRSVRNLIERYQTSKWEKRSGIIPEAVEQGMALKRRNVPYLRRHLDDLFSDYTLAMGQHVVLIRTCVLIAPLLGLLGTVSGMIETFDSLVDMAMFTQDGGIAGGISQALITTQFGLAIAIPGLLVARYLERRQTRIEMDLNQIKDILCSMPIAEQKS